MASTLRASDRAPRNGALHLPAADDRSLVEGIVTPEAVLLELATAGVGSRLLAGLIDGAIVVGGLTIVLAVLTPALGDSDAAMTIAAVLLLFCALLVFPVIVQLIMRGRTVGKAALGLRAVTTEGAPIRLRHALLRTMGGLVDHIVPPGGITGVLFVAGTRRGQSVGDLLAGTIVVREPPRYLVPTAWWFPVPRGYEQYAAALDPTPMSDAQYSLVREFLLRTTRLTPVARHQIGVELADGIAATLGVRRDPRIHPEAFLLCAVSRYQRRNLLPPNAPQPPR